MSRVRAAVRGGAVLLVIALSACTPGAGERAVVSGMQTGGETSDTPAQPRPEYVALADAVVARGGRVWIEADLVKAWQQGPQRYREVLTIVTALASRPGVGGVKVADELGYGDGMDRPQAVELLRKTTSELHARLPGRKVMVDLIVPELGCLAWQDAGATPDARAAMESCRDRENGRYPATSLAAVDAYVAEGGLDVINLSAGLRSDSDYAAWGTTRDEAMASIWDEASRRWGDRVQLQARKALGHPGRYEGSAATAERDVHTWVDIPLAHGASAVDIWTWSQPYKGDTYQLMDPGLADNALITALRARRATSAELWTHMTPSSLHLGLDPDAAAATSIFNTILVASGTG